MTENTTLPRLAAIAAGAVILGISAHHVVTATGQTGAHAALTYALSGGVLVGALVHGRASQVRRGLGVALLAAMIAGEAANVLASAETVILRRDASGAVHRTQAGAHAHAVGEVAKADAALTQARDAVALSASKPGCKDRCVTILREALAAAEAQRAEAVRVYDANPAPQGSAAPFADRIGVPAWVLDLVLAGLVALGANGLAALLVAYGASDAHGSRTLAASAPQQSKAQQIPMPNPDTIPDNEKDDLRRIFAPGGHMAPKPNRTNNRTPSPALRLPTPQPRASGTTQPRPTPKQAVAAQRARSRDNAQRLALEQYVITETALGRPIPSQVFLKDRFGIPRSTVSDIMGDMEARGLIVRRMDGRTKVAQKA